MSQTKGKSEVHGCIVCGNLFQLLVACDAQAKYIGSKVMNAGGREVKGQAARWRRGAKRWSFNILWRQFRAALLGTSEIQVIWTRTPDNWLKKEALLSAFSNSIAASARI